MKQENTPQMSRLEIALTQELAEVEQRIKELRDEALALRRQIGKASVKRQGLEFATRKNSISRLLVENSVLETLRETGKPTKTAVLYKAAKVTNADLKENTFRTYLHRMKKKDLIQTARKAGEWKLTESN